MAYIINIHTGKRGSKNFTNTTSTPLSNKEKVRRWIKRNPVGNTNTKVTIKNTINKKTITTTKGSGGYYGKNIISELKRKMEK